MRVSLLVRSFVLVRAYRSSCNVGLERRIDADSKHVKSSSELAFHPLRLHVIDQIQRSGRCLTLNSKLRAMASAEVVHCDIERPRN